MTRTTPTLTPDFKSNDPYGWLSGDDDYQLPQEWIDNSPAPEIHSTRILASYDQPGYERLGAFAAPLFLDPEYGVLTMAEREFIGTVVSSINSCPTCLLIHGTKLGDLIGDHGRARRIAINYRAVELSVEERAIADFCVKLTERPGRMEPADVQALRDAGLNDQKIFYVVELIAVYNMTNRMTSGYGVRPDDGFLNGLAPRG